MGFTSGKVDLTYYYLFLFGLSGIIVAIVGLLFYLHDRKARRWQGGQSMRIARSFIVSTLIFPFLLGGCATLEVAREVQSGRRAMQLGNPKAAIRHFEAAAQLDPDYITDFTILDIGIWSYAGMAYYEVGEREKALASFKKAKQRHSDDYFARIFLGLMVSQNGQSREGRAELVDGLKGLGHWLETVPDQTRRGMLWDPGNYLAKGIAQTLTMLEAEEINRRAITENVVWLARNFDEEIDEVKTDRDYERAEDDGEGTPR